MKKLILILGLALALTFLITLTALATPNTYVSGFFYPAAPPYDFCYATGDSYIKDGFMDGCGTYITENNGLGQTAIWDGWVDGKYGSCVIHVRLPIQNQSHVSLNQCEGDLAGLHIVADGEFITFTWWGWYHWEILDE